MYQESVFYYLYKNLVVSQNAQILYVQDFVKSMFSLSGMPAKIIKCFVFLLETATRYLFSYTDTPLKLKQTDFWDCVHVLR